MDKANAQFALMFVIATIGMLLLAISIVVFVLFYQKRMLEERLKRQDMEASFQKKMLKAILDSQEKERRRLAGDLHDSVGAMLSTIKMGISTMVRTKQVEEESVKPTKAMLDTTIESVRSISRDLMPSTLEKFGLSQALSEICERIAETAGILVPFEELGVPISVDKAREIMIFRIVQELVNNALKHAQATRISVQMTWKEANGLAVTVRDNGVGFDYSLKKNELGAHSGIGLFNMENRASMIGARMSFESPADGGACISLEVDLSYEE